MIHAIYHINTQFVQKKHNNSNNAETEAYICQKIISFIEIVVVIEI